MKNQVREDLKKSFMGSAGWLFADLLLVLAMIFLIASTVSLPKPPKPPVAPPTATATKVVKATQTAAPPRLENQYRRFHITVNPDKLLSHDVGESNSVIRQVKAQAFLHNRSAGLIIVYGGAPTVNDIPTATDIANSVYNILIDLGKHHDATFGRVSKYDPLYVLGGDPSDVSLDIFLFAQ